MTTLSIWTHRRWVSGCRQLRASFEAGTGLWTTPAPPPLSQNDVPGYGPLGEEFDGGKPDLLCGDGRDFADHPDKPFDVEPGGALAQTSATYNRFETLRTAGSEVIRSSPCFVPGPVSTRPQGAPAAPGEH